MAIKSWPEFWFKLADNFASMKMETLIFASWALAVGLLGSPEWLGIAGVVLGGRVLTDMKWLQRSCEAPVNGDTQV